MSENAITSGAALPSMGGDYRVIIRWAFVGIPTRSQVIDWWRITSSAMAILEPVALNVRNGGRKTV